MSAKKNKSEAYFPTERRFKWQEIGAPSDAMYTIKSQPVSGKVTGFGSGTNHDFIGRAGKNGEAGPGSYNLAVATGKQILSDNRSAGAVKFSQAPIPSADPKSSCTISPGPIYE
jgi:hypothetical protein